MITKILANFRFAMVLSKLISIHSIIIQVLLLVAAFSVLKRRYPKVQKAINIGVFILLIITGILIYDGRFSEQVINDFQGEVYFGQTENGQANGWGRLFDEERNIKYIGYFHNNKYEGKGRLYYYSDEGESRELSSKYEGEFVDEQYCGRGKYYFYHDGKKFLRYDGEYRDGSYCGKGKYIFYDKNYNRTECYDGGWAYGNRFGFGVCEWSDSDDKYKYEGTYVFGKRSGWGKYYENNEIVYDGEWANDTYEGEGTYYYFASDGERRTYTGGFSDGKKHGHGTIYDKDNNILQEGRFKEDVFVEE